ncbi:hypothetical protein Fot_28076 [Forsythia ovata]|uniref:Uncharacterized protein n=1 Tax=Forsythia ovata TaxID=205694 RepID=A0ABD1TN02_9LAMI
MIYSNRLGLGGESRVGYQILGNKKSSGTILSLPIIENLPLVFAKTKKSPWSLRNMEGSHIRLLPAQTLSVWTDKRALIFVGVGVGDEVGLSYSDDESGWRRNKSGRWNALK